MIFKSQGARYFVENKIIRGNSDECTIKNGLAQCIEYLSLYTVTAGIFLVFDHGRGADTNWHNRPEADFINLLTIHYPLYVVRVRQQHTTQVYTAGHQA